MKSFQGKGDMEHAQNSKLNPLTIYCNLELESARLSYGFCIPFSLRLTFDYSLLKTHLGAKKIWSGHEIEGSSLILGMVELWGLHIISLW